jgi:hypothetical protein
MKRDYKKFGYVPVEIHGPRFQRAVELINEKGGALQKATIASARATVGDKTINE